MSQEKKDLAIAILKGGRSFEEASKISGVDVNVLFKLWEEKTK